MTNKKDDSSPKTKSTGEKKTRGKKYQESVKLVDKNKLYSLKEAIKLTKKTSKTTFDGNLETHLSTITTGDLGELNLPHFKGAKKKKVVIANTALVEKIKKGKIDFDILISTPQMMSKLVPFARTLGPKGLMPNPKNGTLTDKPQEVLKKFESGGIRIKTEKKAPVVHLIIGKISQKQSELEKNLETLIETLKPENIKKLTVNATMGPGVKVDLSPFSKSSQ